MKIGQCGYTVCVTLRQSFERTPTGTAAFWKNGRFMSDAELAAAPYVKPVMQCGSTQIKRYTQLPTADGGWIYLIRAKAAACRRFHQETSRRLTLCFYQYSVSSTDVSKNASIYGIWYFKKWRLTIWRNAVFDNFQNWRLVSLFCRRLWTTHKMPWCLTLYVPCIILQCADDQQDAQFL